jgi:hypothetical protein
MFYYHHLDPPHLLNLLFLMNRKYLKWYLIHFLQLFQLNPLYLMNLKYLMFYYHHLDQLHHLNLKNH